MQRAYINCQRCYDLGTRLGNYAQDTEAQLIKIQLEEHQHTARDRALQLLECLVLADQYEFDARQGQKICLGCDNSEPSLALYLKKSFPKEFSCLETKPNQKPGNYRTNGNK